MPFPSPVHKSENEVPQSCVTLHDSMDCSLPGSSVHGIFQARELEWGAIALLWFIIRNVCLVFGFWHRVPKVTVGISCPASGQDVFCYVNKATIEKCLKMEVLVDSRPYQVGLELSFLPPHLLAGERD